MSSYPLKNGDQLVFSIDGGPWETLTFKARDFNKIGSAQAGEVAEAVNRQGLLQASVDAKGDLVLATPSSGGHTSLEIDRAASTAAAALGLTLNNCASRGSGLTAARLVSPKSEPFAIPAKAEMRLLVNGRRRRVVFAKGIKPGRATAAQAAAAINGRGKRAIAGATRDGRLVLTSDKLGPESRLEIEPLEKAGGKVDAAALLGFTGAAAVSHPHPAGPATLTCSGSSQSLVLINLTSSPVELHFSTGTEQLPARGSIAISAAQAAHAPLQRLVRQGAVRLSQPRP